MTREEAIANLKMISVAFVEPVTKEQGKLIDDTFDIAINALEQEPKLLQALEQEKGAYNALVKNIQCADCISRQAVMDCFKKWQPYMATRLWDFKQELSTLPSVYPQEPKTGRWIAYQNKQVCSECGNAKPLGVATYCRGCGAKMQ